jgi:hypothetical protein
MFLTVSRGVSSKYWATKVVVRCVRRRMGRGWKGTPAWALNGASDDEVEAASSERMPQLLARPHSLGTRVQDRDSTARSVPTFHRSGAVYDWRATARVIAPRNEWENMSGRHDRKMHDAAAA